MVKVTQSLQLRAGQNLVMTPQLQQAIKLLQLSNQELQDYLDNEIAQNPLLEKVDSNETPATDNDGERNDTPPASDADTDNIQSDFDASWDADRAASKTDIDFDPTSSDYAGLNDRKGGFDITDSRFEDRLSETVNLRDYLLRQLYMTFDDARDRLIGALLIDQLDEAGYLREDVRPLADTLGSSPERIERLLASMKEFDPPGIFARDLTECLRLQLNDLGELDAPMVLALQHLDKIAQRDVKGLAKICGVNESYAQDIIAAIKKLNPKPAGLFEPIIVQTVVPDIFMRALPKDQGGGWRIDLNNDTLPRVLVNQAYFNTVMNDARSEKDKSYLNDHLQSANWLIRALDQRAQTILKVTSAIVERQDAFFLYGVEFLKPMTLRDIAEAISMHESTVSRVTTNKYIGTPRGVFELKYFFSSSVGGDAGGMEHAAEAVKARIKALIDAEKPTAILSDDDLVDLLKKEGIDIARRTVAKYRDALKIGSSVARRRQKKDWG